MNLINAAALKEFPIRIDHYDKENGSEDFVLGIESVLEYAENLPTIEARPVVRGEWELHGDDDDLSASYFCSVCGYNMDEDEYLDSFSSYKFCPNCGADMRG